MKVVKESMQLGGAEFSIETGKLAKQASGSVVVRHGDSMVLVACVGSQEWDPDRPFFPLTVDYRESFYAAGRFPGGFYKREGRASTKETLVCRLIDRPLRPMFTEGYLGETQIAANVVSSDGVYEADVCAMVGAMAAAYLSPVPLPQALSAVRVGLIDGEFIANPTAQQRQESKLDLVVAGTDEAIVMVEAGAEFIDEATMIKALAFAHDNIRTFIAMIEKMKEQMDITKWEVPAGDFDDAFFAELKEKFSSDLEAAICIKGKHQADAAIKAVKKSIVEAYEGESEEDQEKAAKASAYFGKLKEELFRGLILDRRERTDGRAFDEVRPIWTEVGYLPNVHGSSVFTRGETQALVSLTMGSKGDAQILDQLHTETKKHFMLHYNFPPFSVGECRPMRGPGRREIGHGALAERALEPVIPNTEDFPYTIRLVSEILESNGSSSMASVCGGCMALQDAGVPIKAPVAGVAMGLVMEDGKYAVLTDIQGAEDHYGDMDFKVTGSKEGITALQMDIKVKGLTQEILAEALEQARKGRLHILDEMGKTIAESRAELPEHAPQIAMLQIPIDKIRDVIGVGGKVIRGIIEKTGVKIDIEDDGKCVIFSPNATGLNSAKQMVEELIAVPEEGKIYRGKIKRIVDFGAFVEILPNTEGLLHISEIANYRVRSVTDEVQEGEEVMVKVLALEKNGRIRLSRKALLEG
ncbi:polyribonucleotide nucleotidyltransferase [Acanthopleuribacter pedis]|uniref:Polyribonucleotide nucleotidyltransferase n=1 Tax=Acanthopleuribacter pedis TaxID=442870 RepID=A0A8J7QLB0_9BACT|nr:polyribonucleotide nucleotidyltransferase [Acanthopleuribacter pedis]MBO1320065.1 polyribonucleotide nucleotidyltransferase [Acanthopleuribacter pedis]